MRFRPKDFKYSTRYTWLFQSDINRYNRTWDSNIYVGWLLESLGVLSWRLTGSQSVCLCSTGFPCMYLPEPQQKLGFWRIWNLWKLLPSASFAWLVLASDIQFDDLTQKYTIILNIISTRPAPKLTMIHK